MLVWIDLETTGLDASKDKVLEVAAVITDDALNEVARFHRVTSEARRVDFTQVDPYVLEMHSKNDLWTESLQAKDEYVYDESPSALLSSVDEDLADFVRDACAPDDDGTRVLWKPSSAGNKTRPQLAGSTISFDRAFLAAHLPITHQSLH